MNIPEAGKPLRALIVDDSEDDTLRIVRHLRQQGLCVVFTRVDTPEGLRQALDQQSWDLIIADHNMPSFNALGALFLVKQHGEDVPFIIVSGAISEEIAVNAMLAGAHDYVLKGSLKRLGPIIVRELREAENRRKQRLAEEQLHILSCRLLDAQETERRYIACELHDEIGQTLTAIKIGLQGLQHAASQTDFAPAIQENIGLVDHALYQTRNLALDLRPSLLDDLGLVAALHWFLSRRIQSAGLKARLSVRPPEMRLPPEVETVCFRVTQASLTNTLRHAQASRVAVLLRADDQEIQLVVRDNGIGFDVEAARAAALHGQSLGLLAVEERVRTVGGKLEIRSGAGKGTTLRVRFPGSLLPL